MTDFKTYSAYGDYEVIEYTLTFVSEDTEVVLDCLGHYGDFEGIE